MQLCVTRFRWRQPCPRKKNVIASEPYRGRAVLQVLSSFPSVILINDNESRGLILAPIRRRKHFCEKHELVSYLLLLLIHRETVSCKFGEIGCPLFLSECPLSGACAEPRTLNSTRKKGRSWAHFSGAIVRKASHRCRKLSRQVAVYRCVVDMLRRDVNNRRERKRERTSYTNVGHASPMNHKRQSSVTYR